MMKRRTLLVLYSIGAWLEACAAPAKWNGPASSLTGFIVEESLAKGAIPKLGIEAVTDGGRQLFAASHLREKNGGISAYGALEVPRWVRITWREGVDEAHGLYWTTGTIVGDYTVTVLDRIEPRVFERIRAVPGRALRLRFRIGNDGVEFGWAIQQSGKSIPYDIERGGDFVDSNKFELVREP